MADGSESVISGIIILFYSFIIGHSSLICLEVVDWNRTRARTL